MIKPAWTATGHRLVLVQRLSSVVSKRVVLWLQIGSVRGELLLFLEKALFSSSSLFSFPHSSPLVLISHISPEKKRWGVYCSSKRKTALPFSFYLPAYVWLFTCFIIYLDINFNTAALARRKPVEPDPPVIVYVKVNEFSSVCARKCRKRDTVVNKARVQNRFWGLAGHLADMKGGGTTKCCRFFFFFVAHLKVVAANWLKCWTLFFPKKEPTLLISTKIISLLSRKKTAIWEYLLSRNWNAKKVCEGFIDLSQVMMVN